MTAPLALVHRGRGSAGCAEAVAGLLRGSPRGFDVRYVGSRDLTAGLLSGAAVYAQPGGGGLRPAWWRLRRHRRAMREYVAAGGRYLGFCLGGYLAGATPGFGLLPGDTDQYITSAGATVTSTVDTLVEVEWRGRRRELFFQDGPAFSVDSTANVLARYPNGEVAALVAGFGDGRVGVVGPHPEATDDWFDDAGLARRPAADLGHDLIEEVMA
jgi:glutamine amidotransferase-like uncharacterized protein